MNVNLITSRVMHYRQPFFNALVREAGWNLTVVHSGDGTPVHKRLWEEKRVPTVRWGPFRIQRGLHTAASKGDVNVVMFDLHWPMGLLCGLSERSRVPLVWWGQGLGQTWIGRRLRRMLARRCDAVVVYGRDSRQEMICQGIPARRIHVAPNTMWVGNAADTSARTKDSFLFVGRLRARKRVDTLIRALASLGGETTLGLVVAGDGPIRDELVSLADELGVADRVDFVGAVFDPERLRRLFGRAIGYVSPGHVGLGVLHAFAYGVPVVTTEGVRHAPEVEWVREGETGLFVDGSVSSLAQAMLRLDRDRSLARTIGARGFELYVREANPKEMLDGFVGAVESAIRSRPWATTP